MPNPVFFVNAFATDYYRGNTAAVVILERYPAEAKLLALAKEFAFSETAFLLPLGGSVYQLRWFTPEVEVPLCGHATLASARSLFASLESAADLITFRSLSGELTARRKGDLIELNFPSDMPVTHTPDPEVLAALSTDLPEAVFSARQTRNLVVVYPDAQTVLAMQPDFQRLAARRDLPYFGIAVTAAGSAQDYICRYFAPWEGINEDPVTGSAQTFLAPYWAQRLDRTVLSGYQASARGGTFEVEVLTVRVLIRGQAFIYLQGEISDAWLNE